MHFKSTIQTRLGVSIIFLLVLILTLALTTSLTLYKTDQRLESVDQNWLASAEMLGEMADRISEFRLAEAYRALAIDDHARTTAEQLATQHREAVRQIQQDYIQLQGQTGSRELQHFASAWNAYLTAHDAWIHDSRATTEPARNGSGLHQLYRTADDSIDAIIALNAQKAQEAAAVDIAVHRTIGVIIAVCFGALLLAGMLFLRIRNSITRPLAHITEAMRALANGEREVTVPEQNRNDEIGTLAKVFDIFRANVEALEHAHLATKVAQEQAQALGSKLNHSID